MGVYTLNMNHEYYMNEALREAQLAFEKNEVPVGAVIVDADGNIIARAHNLVEHDYSQRSHAESLAIAHASQVLHNWRLSGCWLYVTLEPCLMCFSLITLSRLAGVVYAAQSPIFGYRQFLAHQVIDKKEPLTILDGICAKKAECLLKKFFKKRREKERE